MNSITCPLCTRSYEVEIPAFPAKVFCPDCETKSLVHEDGSVEILIAGTPPAIEPSGTLNPAEAGIDSVETDPPGAHAHPTTAPTERIERAPEPYLGPSKPRPPVTAPEFSAEESDPATTTRDRAHQWLSLPSPGLVVFLLLIAAVTAVALVPSWRESALSVFAAPESKPEQNDNESEPVVAEAPAPVEVDDSPPEETPIFPGPSVPDKADEDQPDVALDDQGHEESTDPSEGPIPPLEEVAPEIAQALESTEARIDADETETIAAIEAFIAGLFQPTSAEETRATDVASNHPAALLQLLGDLGTRLESAPQATLPGSGELTILNRVGQRHELSSTYADLLDQASSEAPLDDTALVELAAKEEFRQLLQHFATPGDSGTPANALTLARMIAHARRGEPALAWAAAAPGSVDLESLTTEFDGEVDTADFESVRELIEWAHDFRPSPASTIRIEASDLQEIGGRARAYLALPLEVLMPHPLAETFPGSVPADAARVDKTVTIDMGRPRWISTGLYAAPGETITVRVPSRLQDRGLGIRIGSHTDDLIGRRDEEPIEFKRFPVVTARGSQDLDEDRVEIGSPFGGEIYIDVPEQRELMYFEVPCQGNSMRPYREVPETELVELEISGAVEMAVWREGMTRDQWREELRKPGPWVELDFGLIAMSVPKEAAEAIDDPSELNQFWDEMVEEMYRFSALPGHRVSGERFHFDLQISNGALHSGYPIMAHLHHLGSALDLDRIRERGCWGFFHELGHNQQPRVITPEGFVETTVNFYSLLGSQLVLGEDGMWTAHRSMTDWEDKLRARQQGSEDNWDNFSLYLPLVKEFGLEYLTNTLRLYWEEAERDHAFLRNRSDDEEMDQWVLFSGQALQRDVCDYFESVRFHVSDSTRRQLAEFEPWEP